MTDGARVTVSVVSHGQGDLVAALLPDLARCPAVARVVVTHNLPEADIPVPGALHDRVVVLRNAAPLGFGANHNQAFRHCSTPAYAIVNPDIRLPRDPFPGLLAALALPRAALVAPAVVDSGGKPQDSVRRYPTPARLWRKWRGGDDGRHRLLPGGPPREVDWAAGMFLVVHREVFTAVGGFDDRFHLYYEDVDLCVRLRRSGWSVLACPAERVVHDARRDSHRRWRYRLWHVRSMLRFFAKHLGRLPAGTDP